MTLAVKPKLMKALLGTAGVLGLALRSVLYRSGVDQKGLLIQGYWADSAIWILTATVVVAIALWCRQLRAPEEYEEAFPRSLFSTVGTVFAGIAFLLSPTVGAPSSTFASIEVVLRMAAAASLIMVSYCRFQGKKPLFLLHCIVCVYLALRLVCQYRLWSADPQIQNYVFYLGAHIALMICAYQLAAFDAGFGSHRKLWAAGMASIYLSTLSLVEGSEPFFLIASIVWIWTNLSIPTTDAGIAHG